MNNSKILYVGNLDQGQTSRERMIAFEELGFQVTPFNTFYRLSLLQRIINRLFITLLGVQLDLGSINKKLLQIEGYFNIIWIDKGVDFTPSTLKKLKSRLIKQGKLVHFNPDDPFGHYHKHWKRFIKTIPLYDIHFVSREENIKEYTAHGAKVVYDYDRSFSKKLHMPLKLSEDDLKKYRVEIGFVGTYAPEREEAIAYLISNGIEVAIYGNGWQNKRHWDIIKPYFRSNAQMGINYVKILNGMRIALHFLRHENRDQQDSRTFEIPACKVFMLAERSPKHLSFFKEGVEADFFSTNEELLEKVQFYSKNEEFTKKIAEQGYLKCQNAGYDHHARLLSMIKKVLQ